ncbi:PREDICTED: fat storage-inducing transmembrane protein 2-like [Branchiostoma belcheri]|uniref:Fat storage-inducing transmembrane protein 2-like n=1 Tax=Branchiostoma belcheri TaxID=7741 RepID=A0A6P5A1L3_BRABE|nr:PREDICTED: fat storage-inducing transmembrane protein 2-like [Branchiostoma belcheri]
MAATRKNDRLFSSMLSSLANVVLVDPHKRIVVYWFVLIPLSIVHDLIPLPESYFSNKGNVLNQHFVKLSWAWTLLVTTVFIALTSYVYTLTNTSAVFKHLSRLLVGTGIWFVFTSIFDAVLHYTGSCTDPDYTDKRTCVKAGFTWNGFDISGHAFLLSFCALLITSELSVLKTWDRLQEALEEKNKERGGSKKKRGTKSRNEILTQPQDDRETSLELYYRLTPIVSVLFGVLSALTFLWEFMLLTTAIYFHTISHKLVGLACGTVSWYLTYGRWYKNAFPGLPGDGPLLKGLQRDRHIL